MAVAIFPGQGSQAPGMGKFLVDQFLDAKRVFQEASDFLSLDLKKLCFDSSESELQKTENTQPAILTTSVATYKVLENQFGFSPTFGAGHSIGEYGALVSAGVLNFKDAIRAVRLRGQAMQNAVPIGQGSMAAVMGLDERQVEFLCEWVQSKSGFAPISPANYNCPGQIVISGSAQAIDWAKNNLDPSLIPGEPKRAKILSLNVSAPFHCKMMEPAQKVMEDFLSQIPFEKPKFSIVQNLSAMEESDPVKIRKQLIEQVCAPVKWSQSLERLKSLGQYQYIEVGFGKVLQGLLKKIDPENFKVFSTSSLEDLKLIEHFLKASGQ